VKRRYRFRFDIGFGSVPDSGSDFVLDSDSGFVPDSGCCLDSAVDSDLDFGFVPDFGYRLDSARRPAIGFVLDFSIAHATLQTIPTPTGINAVGLEVWSALDHGSGEGQGRSFRSTEITTSSPPK